MDDNSVAQGCISNPLVKYLLWVLFNTVGFGLALPGTFIFTMVMGRVSMLIFHGSSEKLIETLLVFVLPFYQGLGFGLIIASCQGIVLGFRKIIFPLWVLLTSIAWFVILTITIYPPTQFQLANIWTEIILEGGGLGLLVGLAQWLLIRRAGHRSSWWMLANILGSIGGLAVTIPIFTDISHTADEAVGFIIYFLIPLFGLVSSSISGLFLIWPIRWFDLRKVA